MVNWILGDLFFKDFGHQGSVKKLWEERWKFPCTLGVYPFHDGQIDDFAPIFEHLIAKNINDPYDDAWCSAFTPTAERLATAAEAAETTGDIPKAIELAKRSSTVYRIARFPYIGTPIKQRAYDAQKAIYMRGAALWDPPLKDLSIAHTHAENGDGTEIPLYTRVPKDASAQNKAPVVLLITGLDGHRPDNFERVDQQLQRGWASVIVDIPGVADCPANRQDPASGDRLFAAVLDWIATQPELDASKVLAWGLSAGGYYAIRLAHVQADKLVGAIGHGAGTHHYIGREWLKEVDHHEYPFDLQRAYLGKYGYGSWEELLEKCQKEYSLVELGIVQKKSCRLLLVNGVMDGCMPIEDSMLLMEYGTPKEGRFIQQRAHMGYPEAMPITFEWMEQVLGTKKQ
ncbi:alpha/beta-hydrolase [Microthyrium microscopicum]|uniref:Alpha/beta-hydrolase n=1 Tax=Microthyrium microscopicum TaxID=703497 RepID=A0A6A6U115_9PEZI|nr:alpha/beta-hydrolase [Microthyrium microscopicum]